MESLNEIMIVLAWIIKELLSNLLEKKSFKKVVEENKAHIDKNSTLIKEVIKIFDITEKENGTESDQPTTDGEPREQTREQTGQQNIIYASTEPTDDELEFIDRATDPNERA